MHKVKQPNTRQLAVVVTFAVVYFIFRMIPTFAMVGVSGGTFSLADVIAPLYGIILGPWGALSVTLGTFLAFAFGRPMIFLGLDFLPSAVDVLLVGLLMQGKRLLAVVIYVVLFMAFLLNPYTSILIPISIPLLNLKMLVFYPWLHLAALIVLISPLSKKAPEWVNGSSLKNITYGVLIFTFIGTIAQHLVGGILYELVLGMLAGQAPETFRLLWNIVFWLYPFERGFLIGLSTVIGVPLVKALRSSGLLNQPIAKKSDLNVKSPTG